MKTSNRKHGRQLQSRRQKINSLYIFNDNTSSIS
jgi:hypothetical protein